MKKKMLIGAALTATIAGGLAFNAMGGARWVDSTGVRGTERLVRSQIATYWDARVAANVDVMSKFRHPEQSATMDPGMLQTEKYEIREIVVDGDEAVAQVVATTRLKHPMFAERLRKIEMADLWVRHEGAWVRKPAPVTLGQAVKAVEARQAEALAAAQAEQAVATE
ncbi:MAG: hypothetical protein GY716_10860 [bacterium]|nr:hypothetical protein [bacterium]